jgi:hypothetical protein
MDISAGILASLDAGYPCRLTGISIFMLSMSVSSWNSSCVKSLLTKEDASVVLRERMIKIPIDGGANEINDQA